MARSSTAATNRLAITGSGNFLTAGRELTVDSYPRLERILIPAAEGLRARTSSQAADDSRNNPEFPVDLSR